MILILLFLTSFFIPTFGFVQIATVIAVVAFPGVGVVGGKEPKVAVVSRDHAAKDTLKDKDEEITVQTTSTPTRM